MELMRAIDYRAPDIGISLLICKSFRNEREAQQGLGRVGRNGDPCQRVLLKDVPLIDQQEQKLYQANLMAFYSQNIAKTFALTQIKQGKSKAGTKLKLLPGQGKLSFGGKRNQPEAETRITRAMSQKQGNEADILKLNELQDDESDGKIDFFAPKVQKIK